MSTQPQVQPDWFDANGQQIPPQSTAQQPSSDWFSDNAPAAGQVTNDVGNTVILPKDNESFLDTMRRAAAQGGKTTQAQIDAEMRTAPGKAATTMFAAPVIGAAGAAGIAASDVGLYQAAKGLGYAGEAVKDALTTPMGKTLLHEAVKRGMGAAGWGIVFTLAKKAGMFSK